MSFNAIGKTLAKGAVWMVALKFIERALGLISTLILARLLVPQDFGLIAIAMSILGLLEVLGSFGFDIALIQNQRADRRYYDTAWTLTVGYGVLSSIAIICIAVPCAHFFREPRLEYVLYAISIVAVVQGFENVGVVAFQKDLDFRKEFGYRLIKRVAGFGITIVLAFALKSYWALVAGALASRFIGVLLSYLLHPYRPSFSLAAIGDLWRFSGWMLVNNIVVFGAVKGYDFLIGRLGGPTMLGIYSVSYEISNLPTTELVHPISRAIFPGFARFAEDPVELRSALVMSMSLVAIIAIPMGAGIALLAEPLVLLLLGEKWSATIPVVQVLAVYGVMRTAHAGTGAAYLALGESRLIAIINLPHILVGCPLMAFMLVNFDLVAASYSLLCASALGLIINFICARKHLRLTGRSIMECFWRPLVAIFVMGILVKQLLQSWPPAPQVLTLIVQTGTYVALGAIVYVVVISALWIICGRPVGAEQLIVKKVLSHSSLYRFYRS